MGGPLASSGGDMRTMKRIVVAFLIVIAALVLLFFASTSPFSVYSAIYECSGDLITQTPGKSGPIKQLFVKITQYKWWVAMNPLDGYLQLEFPSATGPHPPTIPDTFPNDPSVADRWFRFPEGDVSPGRLFPGLFYGRPPSEREDLFVVRRTQDYLTLFRWPKAGETLDFGGENQGRFSTISNSLWFKLSDGVTSFNGTCTSKNN
jgi:hypothetical protein